MAKTIYEQLTEEHRQVSDLLAQTKKAKADSSPGRAELFQKLKVMLTAHSEAEQAVVYTRFRELSKDARDEVKDDLREHREIEDYLEQLTEMEEDSKDWLSVLSELEECIEHHVSDEENELFPEAKQHLADEEAQQIRTEYLEAKAEQLNALLGDDYDDMTVEELYDAAQQLDISGRSNMNKDQLISALRR